MLSGFKNLFKSKGKENSKKDYPKDNQGNNSEDLAEQDTAEKTADLEKEEEKMRFRLAMDIFKEEDVTKTSFEISLYDSNKMYENFYGETLKNWR